MTDDDLPEPAPAAVLPPRGARARARAAALPNPLDAYPVDVRAGDLYRDAAPAVGDRWRAAAAALAGIGRAAGLSPHDLLARQIQDLGLSFRLTGDRDERPWPMTAMPLIVGAEEWAGVERGLIQRAELLEAVAADIHGPQRLVADGHLPAAVIAGSRFFARNMVGLAPHRGHMLQVCAVDLARGPQGQWRVLADRLRLANGIGYALENRLALTRATGPLLGDIHARRHAAFFVALREGIAANCAREEPRIALLTPGRFNQSYPEQAHLARYLGFPLVEGRDLVVTDDRLFVRTIAGPKRIDALWRWLDSNALDPLNFDSRSRLGVPDLFSAWARGGLAMANWPGVEVLESPALAAFMPRLCEVVLGEEPVLPNIATWWCGQAREAAEVMGRLDELTVTPAFGQNADVPGSGPAPFAPAALDRQARAELVAAMARRPMDWCGQEIVHLSTTPALIGDALEPRAFTVRAFMARGADGGWQVMPGGFARLSASGAMFTSLMGEGDLSADLCIVESDAARRAAPARPAVAPAVRRQGGILASQAADNLFWFGRYCERAEAVTRAVRALLGGSLADGWGANPAVRAQLVGLLVTAGALAPGMATRPVEEIARAVLTDRALPNSLASLLATIRDIALLLRDRFAPDVWRTASRPPPTIDALRPGSALGAARQLVARFSVLSGLAAENMVRGPSWHFLKMGYRLERSLSICRVVRQLAGADKAKAGAVPGTDALAALLDICDSQISYHARYLAGVARAPVLDLLLLDPANPRALVFQLEALAGHIAALPALREDAPPEAPLRLAHAALGPLQATTVAAWDEALLAATEARLLALSEAIAERYFLHVERGDGAAPAALLA